MVESARKHGPFDRRYPVRPKRASPDWGLRPHESGAQRLEWSAFLARFFPDRHRHDFEALAAYEADRNGIDASRRVRGEASSAALLAWESEGGAQG